MLHVVVSDEQANSAAGLVNCVQKIIHGRCRLTACTAEAENISNFVQSKIEDNWDEASGCVCCRQGTSGSLNQYTEHHMLDPSCPHDVQTLIPQSRKQQNFCSSYVDHAYKIAAAGCLQALLRHYQEDTTERTCVVARCRCTHNPAKPVPA